VRGRTFEIHAQEGRFDHKGENMETFLKVLGTVALVAFILMFEAWLAMLLINYLFTSAVLTTVFGVAEIGFWRAWCLIFLANLFHQNYNKK
jgi:hypothetical protein